MKKQSFDLSYVVPSNKWGFNPVNGRIGKYTVNLYLVNSDKQFLSKKAWSYLTEMEQRGYVKVYDDHSFDIIPEGLTADMLYEAFEADNMKKKEQ